MMMMMMMMVIMMMMMINCLRAVAFSYIIVELIIPGREQSNSAGESKWNGVSTKSENFIK
jgi:hypothetical protein